MSFVVPQSLGQGQQYLYTAGGVAFYSNQAGGVIAGGVVNNGANASAAAVAAGSALGGSGGGTTLAGRVQDAAISLFGKSVKDGIAYRFDDPSRNLPEGWVYTRKGAEAAVPVEVVAPTASRPLKPIIQWPGVISPISLNYTNSHSTSPGIATLTLNPQSSLPAALGNLTFGDSLRRSITLKDCAVLHYESSTSGNGSHCTLTIADRRWRWAQTHTVDGEYNRLDDHGNLVPWTIRSATELAELCLDRLGEKRYTIGFPPGLKRAQASGYDTYLRNGIRFPLTNANPYVRWDVLPAALALQQLADMFGCRVMYDPVTDRILVLPLGVGKPLPYQGQSIAQASQGMDTDRTPKYICVEGAPIKFQVHLSLEAVGEEWNDYFENIEYLSYAPERFPGDPRKWSRTVPPSFATVTPTERLEFTEAMAKANQSIYRAYRIRERSDDLKTWEPAGIDVDGSAGIKIPGLLDDICVGPNPTKRAVSETWNDASTFKAINGQATYPVNTLAGGRLRSFNVTTDNLAYLKKFHPQDVPKYYRTVRRHQIILTPFKVDQIVPSPRRDADIVIQATRVNPDGSLPDYYNGYSRDRPAECFGTYFAGCSNVIYRYGQQVIENRRVYIDFTVNTKEQIVMFQRPLWTVESHNGTTITGPCKNLFIETGVHVLDSETNAPIRCKYWVELGGNADGVHETHEDIVTHIVGIYEPPRKLVTDSGFIATIYDPGSRRLMDYKLNDFGDGKKRAQYYLTGMKRRFQKWQSQTVTYNGCLAIQPSGMVRQIHWNVGSTITTTAGANTEFSPVVPAYPQRKLEENMTADAIQREQNLLSKPLALTNLVRNVPFK